MSLSNFVFRSATDTVSLFGAQEFWTLLPAKEVSAINRALPSPQEACKNNANLDDVHNSDAPCHLRMYAHQISENRLDPPRDRMAGGIGGWYWVTC